jgi:alanyl aminopeptidase
VAAVDGATAPPAQEAVPLGRLPEDVRPLSYDLSLTIDPGEERFSGAVRITVQMDRARSSLWLHGQDLHVTKASLAQRGGEALSAAYTQVHPSGVVRVDLPRPVGPGEATLALTYDAAFGTRLQGLFRVRDGGHAYAFTHFEPLDARRCFPGFDEPGFKTPFEVSLTVRNEHKAIANTSPVGEEPVDATRKRVRFGRSEKLPTYLVAFAVGPLDLVTPGPIAANAVRPKPLPLRGVAAKGRGGRLHTALSWARGVLDAQERYFGIPYPYEKLDLIAVPDMGGAMENAGAVTFAEQLLLLKEPTATTGQKRSIASVMAHELAHQWVGNLVTMRWWDDLWLSEAFASWMTVRTLEAWRPEQKGRLRQWEAVQEAMRHDLLVAARQIRQPIESPHDIENAFDSITYQKGSGVLSMFERYLGAEAFQRGVRHYLKKFRFQSATTEQFLEAVSEATGKSITAAFRTFLDQPGVPLLEVEPACPPGRPPELRVRQSRLLPLGSKGDPQRLWQIPACFRFESGGGKGEDCRVLTRPEETIPLAAGACPSWVHPNAEAAGYYRFVLSREASARLLRALAELSPLEQLALADSLWVGIVTGRLKAQEVLGQLAPFAKARERLVAEAPMRFLRYARSHLVPPPLLPRLEAFARSLYAEAFARLGFDSKAEERDEERLFRRDLLAFLARTARDPVVRGELGRRGADYLGLGKDGRLHREAVAPDLVGLALGVAVEEGGAPVFEALLAHLQQSDDAALRRRFLGALGRVTAPDLGERARALALSPVLRVSEIRALLGALARRKASRPVLWAWLEKNYEPLVARLPDGAGAHLPWFMASRACTEAEALEIERFFAPRIEKLSGGPRNLRGALEAVRECAALAAVQGPSARAFFERL